MHLKRRALSSPRLSFGGSAGTGGIIGVNVHNVLYSIRYTQGRPERAS